MMFLIDEDVAAEVSAVRSTAVGDVGLVIKKWHREALQLCRNDHGAETLKTGQHTNPEDQAQAKNVLLAGIKKQDDT